MLFPVDLSALLSYQNSCKWERIIEASQLSNCIDLKMPRLNLYLELFVCNTFSVNTEKLYIFLSQICQPINYNNHEKFIYGTKCLLLSHAKGNNTVFDFRLLISKY